MRQRVLAILIVGIVCIGWGVAPVLAQSDASLPNPSPSDTSSSRTSTTEEAPPPETVRPDDSACETNVVVILRPGKQFMNDCPSVRYVVQKSYFDDIYRGYASGQQAVPLVDEALADRDSLITVLEEKESLLDSTRQALMQLSSSMSDESLRVLTETSDTLSIVVIPELRAVRNELQRTQSSLRKAERRLFWSRIKFAAIPALAGVALGVLVAR